MQRQRRSGRLVAPPPQNNNNNHRTAMLRQVSNILKKKESARSSEELAVLSSMKDIVKEVNFRIQRRQETLDRNKEIEDDYVVLRNKCKRLAVAVKKAKHLVVYTGAGISTAADIPDYRGPNGIWTLLQQGKNIGKHDLTRADPTLTHMALWKLYTQKYLKFVVSQNCDGLHLRSGLPKRALSEVHGNMYIEICKTCKPNVQYWRLFDTTEKTVRFNHKTGRICHVCGNSLEDSIVHFGERGVAQWPLNWSGALYHAEKADVILCLGSSLKVLKKYPWLWAMNKPIKKRPDIFIVNLQWTPKDDVAVLKINGKCDNVMKMVMEFLELETPKYDRRNDPIFAHTSYLCPKELHTTTMPMLIKNIPKIDSEKDKSVKNGETDDSDDDCPLNLLKMKMSPCDEEQPLDLSVSLCKNSETVDDIKLNRILALRGRTLSESETVVSNMDNILRMNSKFSSSPNEQSVKTDRGISSKNSFNEEIDKPTDLSKKNCKYENNLEEIFSEENLENFERVNIEMKTSDTDFCKVCILLVKNSKKNSLNKFPYANSHINGSIINSKTMSSEMNMDSFKRAQCGISTKNRYFSVFPSVLNEIKEIRDNSTIVKCHRISHSFKNIYGMMKNSDTLHIDNGIFNKTHSSFCNSHVDLCMKVENEEIGNSKEPLDYSVKLNLENLFIKKGHNICNPHYSNKEFDDPVRLFYKSEDNSICDVLDLTFSINKTNVNDSGIHLSDSCDNLENNFSSVIRFHETIRKTPINIFQKCEYFAKLIIQNTVLVNSKEVKYAYSGLHSIINPVPFYIEYDFTNVFNAFNLIKVAQNMLSKNKIINRRRGSIFKNEQAKKRKFRFKQKSVPDCKFCHENYRSYICNFYTPYNSEQRFEKWHKGKLIMCDCCGDTETSESESELSDANEDSDDPKEANGNGSPNNDLEDCVQISVNNIKVRGDGGDNVQAGWFGKGFRKNRRRKR